MKSHLLTILFLVFSTSIFSQEITAKLVDTKQNPIAYATVKTAENKGVISNEEGFFTINTEDISNNTIEISCLGFTSKNISIEDLESNNYIVVLEEFVDELNEVFLSNMTLNADDIIRNANNNLSKNYKNEGVNYNLFFRNTSYVDFSRLEFEIKKATGFRKKQLKNVNLSLDSLAQSVKNSNAIFFRDYVSDLMINNKEDAKLKVHKATTLIDKNKNFSLDKVQERAQKIILKYLDTTQTYKLKSGLFKIEDSLSLKSDDYKNDNENSDDFDTSSLLDEAHGIVHTTQAYDNSILKKILDAEYYEYEYVDATGFNNELVYIINYKPRKSKAKYQGTLYISEETYAVLKLDYTYAKGKRGDKVNLKLLLGVKYVENVSNGVIIFEKGEQYYQPKYIKEETGNFFYVSRPIKFIENSDRKNKVGFNFLIEGGVREKNEVYIISSKTLDIATYKSYKQVEKTPFERLKKYDPNIWKSYNALEPLEEMKQFKSSEN